MDCGHCDVCLKKNASGLPNWLFRRIGDKLKNCLAQRGPVRLNELVDVVSDKEQNAENAEENGDKVILVLRFLIDAGEFTLEDDVVSLVKDIP